jgi:hypothetical protein
MLVTQLVDLERLRDQRQPVRHWHAHVDVACRGRSAKIGAAWNALNSNHRRLRLSVSLASCSHRYDAAFNRIHAAARFSCEPFYHCVASFWSLIRHHRRSQGLLRAALATPSTKQSYNALVSLDKLVKDDDELLIRAIPVYLHHLSASKLLDVRNRGGDGDGRIHGLDEIEEVRHAIVCLSGLVRPSPRCGGQLPGIDRPDSKALIHAASFDILRWTAFFLERCFDTSSERFFAVFAKVATRAFPLLRADVLYSRRLVLDMCVRSMLRSGC